MRKEGPAHGVLPRYSACAPLFNRGNSATVDAEKSVQEHLRTLVHDHSYHRIQPRLAQIFSSGILTPRPGATGADRHQLTYARLRHLTESVDARTPLLGRRDLLFPLLEWAAIADPSLFYAFFLHHCTVVGAIREFGKDQDGLEDVLADLGSTSVVGALLMTELGHGNSNAAVRTVASYDHDRREFTINTPVPEAVKYPPSVAADGIPRLGIVTARLMVDEQDCGIFCFAVPLRDTTGPRPGVRIEPHDSSPLLPLDWAAVSFDHVRIPYTHWLRDSAAISDDGTFTDPLSTPAMRSRQASRLIRYVWEGAAVGLAAITRASAAIAVRHAHVRHTNGTFAGFAPDMPVIRYRNQQRTLFGALASAYVAAMAARVIASPEPLGGTAGGIRTLFTLKAVIDQIAERVTAAGRAATGVLGFSPSNRLLEYQGLAHSFNAAGLSTQVLYLNAAWTMALGLDYEPPADDTPGRNPTATAAEWDLADPALWATLIGARERRLHQELTGELGKARENGLNEFDVWNDRFELAERTAQAHAQRLLVDIVRTATDGLPDGPTRQLAQRLCALHFLSDIHDHGGWYLTEGLLTADDIRRIPGLLNQLCDDIAPHALDLADALDVAYDVVGAPIAHADYVSAYTQAFATR